MNRGDLQRLSNARIREAKILFRAGEFSGAYYLSGYAVECALKACFARTVKRYDFPDRTGAGKIFTHNLPELVTLVNLDSELLAERNANAEFAANWQVIRRWTERSRYSNWLKDDAETILDAIAGRRNGVLPWIKRYW
jgi:HEPN domain-containing protein